MSMATVTSNQTRLHKFSEEVRFVEVAQIQGGLAAWVSVGGATEGVAA